MQKRWFTLIALTLTFAARAQTAIPVDENRLTGSWFEIAHLPDKHEKSCTGDAVELIARADKPHQLQWVQSCRTKLDVDSRTLTAKPQNKKSPDGRYKVTTIWPLSKKYYVLALNEDSLIVGSPDHKSLWVYAKTATLKPDALDAAESHAAAQGYPKDRLVLTHQSTQ